MKKLDDIIKPLIEEGTHLKMHHNNGRVLELANKLIVWSLEMDDAIQKISDALDA